MKKILILLICLYANNAFALLKTRTDAVSINESAVFQLEIQADGNIKGTPDLKPLQADFEIVGQSSNQSYRSDGNNEYIHYSFILSLMPKRTGILTIPQLTWGKEKTQALQIDVHPDSSTFQVQNENAVIIEAEPQSSQTYQGAGFLYRVKVFERIGLIEGEFFPPRLEKAEIIPLGSYTLSQEKKEDILYQVLTQEYVIFPEKAGKDLIIEPAKFQGYYHQKQSTEQLLPFGFTNSFVYQPRTSVSKGITVRANPVQITVLPRPRDTKKDWWLPTTKVFLNETWNTAEKEAKVGEPIIRQIELKAVSVLGKMLPDLTFNNSNEFKVYPEIAQKSQVYEQSIGLIGEETQSFAFIPLKSGQITLPELSVNWFDVNEGKMKTATLPAKTFFVAENPQYTISNKINSVPPKEKTSEEFRQTPNPFIKENNLLYFISGLSIGLLLSVLGIALHHSKRRHKKSLPELYPHEK